jgi:hypothetical protein
MYKKSNDMSELEREFELEMDNDSELEMDDDFEFEAYRTDEDSEADEYEYDSEYEEEPEGEFEWLESNDSDYAERLFELSQREFESESEIDEAVNEILDDMEREYFIGGLFKKAKNAAKKLAQKGMTLAKKAGINLPSLDALKSMLGPVSGLLKGNLGTLIKPALKAALSAHPAGMAALPALKALGFESSEDMGENREAWNRYASVAREAFEHLAENINENADNPLEASRLANGAFQKALKGTQGSHQSSNYRRRSGKKNVRRIYLSPGEVIVIKRK